MKKAICWLLCLGAFIVSHEPGTAAAGTWVRTYGGSDTDNVYAVQPTRDGGYIAVGSTHSFAEFNEEVWVVKLGRTGVVEWEKAYGGTGSDIGFAVVQDEEGGYLVAAKTASFGDDDNVWLLKLDASGGITWENAYDAGGRETVRALVAAGDGGYVAAGSTDRSGGGSFFNAAWAMKVTAAGEIVWQKTYEGVDPMNLIRALKRVGDGGYVLAGLAFGPEDIYLVKVDAGGEMAWQKRYDLGGAEGVTAIEVTSDGGILAVGSSTKEDRRGYDGWAMKLDAAGSVLWQKTYGGTGNDFVEAVARSADGGFVLAGSSSSTGDFFGDCWVFKIDALGNLLWQKAYGRERADGVAALARTPDGGVIAAGTTTSFGAGRQDFWLLKLDADGEAGGCIAGLSKVADTGAGTASVTDRSKGPVSGTATAAAPAATAAAATSTTLLTSQTCTYRPFALPLPIGRRNFPYAPVEAPVHSDDPAECRPVALGDLAGGTFGLRVGLPPFAGPMDVYLAVYLPALGLEDIFLVTPVGLQSFAEGLAPLAAGSNGDIDLTFFEGLALSDLPAGSYFFALFTLPAGAVALDPFDLWITGFTTPE